MSDEQSWLKRNCGWFSWGSPKVPKHRAPSTGAGHTAKGPPRVTNSSAPTNNSSTPTNNFSTPTNNPSTSTNNPPTPTNNTAGARCHPRTDVTASQTPSELPSQVEETLEVCPEFRILLVGNTGVGKSTLVSSVFNIVFNVSLDGTIIDVAHDRAGIAKIESQYYYEEQNPRFILHDSMGFEPGSTDKSEIVKKFLRERAGPSVKLLKQVHAIWLCIETPRKGSRLLQTGDEELLTLAKELKIPVIVVLTKYDLLIMEHYRACRDMSLPGRNVEVKKRVELAYSKVTEELKKLSVPFAPVSTRKETQKEYGATMLVGLTQVTQDNLRDDVAGLLRALWATAQQINARQKVELSINEGLKKYWKNLSESDSFQGHPLVDCIARIHDDVLKVWNFNDPTKVLSGEEFLKGMLGLVESLSVAIIRNQRANNIVSSCLVLPALGKIIGMEAFQYLRSKYQKGVSTATYLAAYIVDLTLVLFEISRVVTVDPPKKLSTVLVMGALAMYKSSSSHIHAQVKEEEIASVIRSALPKAESTITSQ